MEDRNLYMTYKRDTKYLVYWMIHAPNHILRGLEKPEHDSLGLNTTGQTTVSGLVAMSKLIAANVIPVRSVIQRLLKSIIDARSQPGNPDEEADLDELILSNKFSTLRVTTGQAGESESDADDSEPEIHNAPRRRQASKAGKGKKGKVKKKACNKKASGRTKSTLREADLDDVPLERFRIIEDFNEGQ
ncbi:unnamed protein product [Clonostachys chloroleuca]|uniref:DUF6604 domain-containing protein n=1 Tax=Clonostachys chloroleuca TaxID=1926264 RepID=A0AA35MCN7_9HYPO|nr:unnamed protein product [Clonostachys chloroleuca]